MELEVGYFIANIVIIMHVYSDLQVSCQHKRAVSLKCYNVGCLEYKPTVISTSCMPVANILSARQPTCKALWHVLKE